MSNLTEECMDLIGEVRRKAPLIHNITNYVTVNDCANACLAIGASPIMADDITEVEEITAASSALVLNIGTLNQRTKASMIAAGKRANELQIPVILDPVGAGASVLRNQTILEILSQIKIDVLRGNLSEVSFVAGQNASAKGVDAAASDLQYNATEIAKMVAKKFSCTVVVTGKIDTISDGDRFVKIANGHEMLSKVTGTGCMSSALVGCFCGAAVNFYAAAVVGIAAMGIAGEIAYEKAGTDGIGSFHMKLMDAISNFDAACFTERVRMDEY